MSYNSPEYVNYRYRTRLRTGGSAELGTGWGQGTVTPGLSYPVTMAAFTWVADHPVSNDGVMNLCQTQGDFDNALYLNYNNVADQYRVFFGLLGGTTQAVYTAAAGEYDGVWLPLVGVFVSATERYIYVGDAANVATDTTTTGAISNYDTIIVNATSNGLPHETGSIAKAALWDINLSTAQIGQFMAGVSPLRIARDNLQGYWPMNEQGPLQHDLSGHGRHLTCTATPTITQDKTPPRTHDDP